MNKLYLGTQKMKRLTKKQILGAFIISIPFIGIYIYFVSTWVIYNDDPLWKACIYGAGPFALTAIIVAIVAIGVYFLDPDSNKEK